MDYARAAMQGVMFGFSDEAAGLFRAIYDAATKGKSVLPKPTRTHGTKPAKILMNLEKTTRWLHMAQKSLRLCQWPLIGGAGLARAGVAAGKGLGAAVGRGAIEGATYGLGAGEGDAVDQAASTMLGGATGAALTGAVGGVLRF